MVPDGRWRRADNQVTPRSARDAIGAIESLPEGRTALIARARCPIGGRGQRGSYSIAG